MRCNSLYLYSVMGTNRGMVFTADWTIYLLVMTALSGMIKNYPRVFTVFSINRCKPTSNKRPKICVQHVLVVMQVPPPIML